MEDRTPQEAIAHLLPEIEEAKQKVKTLREQLKDVTEQNDEYQKIQEEISELTTKRSEAKKLLMADKDYQVVNADLDDEKIKLKDLGEILSHYLVSYYSETKKTQITDTGGETRQVVLSAKLGKAEAMPAEDNKV